MDKRMGKGGWGRRGKTEGEEENTRGLIGGYGVKAIRRTVGEKKNKEGKKVERGGVEFGC